MPGPTPRWGLLCLLAALVAGPALAVQPLRFDKLNSAALSHNSVYAILRDSQGFLWFGTGDGLNRYDGYEVQVFHHDPADPNSLSSNVVWSLLENRQGHLWIGTESGLDRYRPEGGDFHRLQPGSDGAPAIVRDLAEDSQGRIWVATSSGLDVHLPDTESVVDGWTELDLTPDPLPYELETRDLFIDSNNRLWILHADVGGETAVIDRVDFDRHQVERLEIDPAWGTVYTLIVDSRQRLWINALEPASVDEKRGLVLPPTGGSTWPHQWTVTAGRDDELWFGTGSGLFGLREGVEPTRHPLDPDGNTYLTEFVRSLFWDEATGDLWVGTHGGLFHHDVNVKPFHHLRHQPNRASSLSSDVVSAVWQDPIGAVWVGTLGGGLDRVDPATGRARRYLHDESDPTSLPHDVVRAIQGDGEGLLWIAVANGLCAFDPTTQAFSSVPLPLSYPDEPRFGTSAFDLALDEEGGLWIGSAFEIFRLEPAEQTLERFPIPGARASTTSRFARSIQIVSSGRAWFGTEGERIGSVDPDTGNIELFELRTRRGKPVSSEGVWDIHEDGTGRGLWLATGAGLALFDPDTGLLDLITTADGLPGSVVYSILEDNSGSLWLGTSRGLAHFDPRDSGSTRFRTFDTADGTGSTEFNRHSAHRGADGTLFFGGLDGLTYFDPRAIRDNPIRPPVALTSVEVSNNQGTRQIPPGNLQRLELSHQDSTFAFEFAALSFSNPARNRYAYRLQGVDKQWVDAGTRRFARYTNVPPGRYLFRVRGSNNDGLWNEEGLALPVLVRPAYWQTFWFRTFLVAAAIGLLVLAYALRVRHLLAVERLRLRIAGDLHDELSSDLSGVAVVTDLLRKRPYLPTADRQRLDEVRAGALRMVGGLKDIIWTINPEHDTNAALLDRMQSTNASLLAGTEVELSSDLPGSTGDLEMGLRRSLWLVYKEALHNIAKHAEAERVEIRLAVRDGRLTLHIADDGVGFDPDSDCGGDGLRNMHRRARRMGGELTVESRPDAGTTLLLDVPMARSASRKLWPTHRSPENS